MGIANALRLVGDKYLSAHILGIDLSPIQPDWLPPNVRFMVDDVESPWLHPSSHFDYIHSRHTVMAVRDWMKLFRRAIESVTLRFLPLQGQLLTYIPGISKSAAGLSSKKFITLQKVPCRMEMARCRQTILLHVTGDTYQRD
jgi:hypothetical protein